jgi:hypothetical protein
MYGEDRTGAFSKINQLENHLGSLSTPKQYKKTKNLHPFESEIPKQDTKLVIFKIEKRPEVCAHTPGPVWRRTE